MKSNLPEVHWLYSPLFHEALFCYLVCSACAWVQCILGMIFLNILTSVKYRNLQLLYYIG